MIVLDAGVVIAYLAPADAHHHAAEEFLLRATVELLVNPVTLAEILVFPTRENRVEEALATLSDIGVVEFRSRHTPAATLPRCARPPG